MLTQAIEDYLKAIYKLQRRGERVTNSAVADEIRVKPASVTSMMKQLAQLKLVRYTPYRGVELTPGGEKIALEVIRHHRLLELYLSEFLGFPWDRVHEEADRLEHVISPELEERMARVLGDPTEDPHGDPIPTKEGTLEEPTHSRLTEVAPRTRVVVRRVSDSDPAKLRYLAELGLVPNAALEVVSLAPFGGPLVVRVGEAEHALGRDLADTIRVSPA